MKHLDSEQIEELLRAVQGRNGPEPPRELLEAIKREIPEYLEPAETPGASARPFWASRRLQLVAASLFVVVVGTIVTSRVLIDEPLVELPPVGGESLERTDAAQQVAQPATSASGELAESFDEPREGQAGDSALEPPSTSAEEQLAARTLRDNLEVLPEALPEADAAEPAAEGAELGTSGSGLGTLGYLGDEVARTEAVPAPPPAAVEPPPDESNRRAARLEQRAAGEREPAETVTSDEARSLEKAEREEEAKPDRDDVAGPAEGAANEQTLARSKVESARPGEDKAGGRLADTVIVFGSPEAPAREAAVRPRSAEGGTSRPRVPSTGGTTEPNDRPYGDVFYEPTGVNPFIDTDDDNLSTFALDVDTGSYAVARRYLEDGNLPDPASIRVEEFVNYFGYGDPAPRRDDFAISVEGAPSPFTESSSYRLLRFAIKAREVAPRERKPATLVFVVDTSGSMEEGNRIGLVKQALMLLLDQLDRDDRVGLVEYSDHARVLLEPTRDKREVERALRYLVPNGSTNAEAGLMLGYDLAGQFFRRNGITRVILCSDGVANVGRTGPGAILERIEREARRGIEITTVGFGMGNYNDVLMEQLADRGDGRYAYVDTLEEAERIFVENLAGTLQTVARDAKVQVEFNPRAVSRYRLLGYENRDVADSRFRDDSVDAGEIGSGHTVTALYEVKLVDGARSSAELATVHLRWESTETRRIREIDETILVGDLDRSWRAAPASLRLAGVVAEFAEILKRSYWARGASLRELSLHAEELERELRRDEVSELVELIDSAARLEPRPPARDE